jgi:hypothetical protein
MSERFQIEKACIPVSAPNRSHMVNVAMVNGAPFAFLPAAKCAILYLFPQKCALQKVR